MENEYYSGIVKAGRANLKFTKLYYDLPFHLKIVLVLPILEDPYLTYITYERIVRSLLQHSSKSMKAEFPVQGVRKISKIALQADQDYQFRLTYERNPID